MKSYEHINPENQDRLMVHEEMDSVLGVFRVYVQGDRGQKPLYTGMDESEANRVFDQTVSALKKSIEA